MNPTVLQQPFFQMTMPIMVTFIATIRLASWSQNKRFDDINRRFDDINRQFDEIGRRLNLIDKRLDSIEHKLGEYGTRITVLEERTSPFGRRG